MGIRIVGTGKYLPEKIVTNEDMARIVDTSDEWITTRTGIKQRPVETRLLNHEMGARAAEAALADAGIPVEEVDLVIASSCTADYLTPSLACLVARELGIEKAACVEINCACAGFVSAVDMAKRYLDDPEYQTALVVSSELLTKMVDYEDRATCVLFGDGAGAVVLQKSEGFYYSEMGSDPASAHHLFARGMPASSQFREEPFDPEIDGFGSSRGLHQDGQDVYKFATRVMPKAIRKACEKAGISPEELDWVFPHQANLRILETAAKNLHLPMEKVYVNIQDHGNMSSACIPVCLAEACEQDRIKPGDKVCIVGFGGGLVYAAAVFEW